MPRGAPASETGVVATAIDSSNEMIGQTPLTGAEAETEVVTEAGEVAATTAVVRVSGVEAVIEAAPTMTHTVAVAATVTMTANPIAIVASVMGMVVAKAEIAQLIADLTGMAEVAGVPDPDLATVGVNEVCHLILQGSCEQGAWLLPSCLWVEV